MQQGRLGRGLCGARPHVWSRGRSRGRRWAEGRSAGWENDAGNEAESRQWRCWWFFHSWQFLSGGAGPFHFGKSWYTSRLFSYEWQIKELGEGENQIVGPNSYDRVARNVPNVNY